MTTGADNIEPAEPAPAGAPDTGPGAAAPDPPHARDDSDVDSLIAEYQREAGAAAVYEEPVAPAPPEPAAPDENAPRSVDDRIDGVLDYIHEEKTAKLLDTVKADVADSIQHVVNIVGDAPGGASAVRGLLIDKHSNDVAFRHAFENRYVAPHVWKGALDIAGREIDAELRTPRVDANATADRAAVAAAVRGSSTAPGTDSGDEIDEKAVAKMSDQEFEEWRKSLGTGSGP